VKVGPADGAGQRVGRLRNHDQVHVVGHQAIPQDVQAVFRRPLLQQRQINAPVVIAEEDVLVVVAALRHVMRHILQHDPWGPGHTDRLPCVVRQG
jgi:hypothetical protein